MLLIPYRAAEGREKLKGEGIVGGMVVEGKKGALVGHWEAEPLERNR